MENNNLNNIVNLILTSNSPFSSCLIVKPFDKLAKKGAESTFLST